MVQLTKSLIFLINLHKLSRTDVYILTKKNAGVENGKYYRNISFSYDWLKIRYKYTHEFICEEFCNSQSFQRDWQVNDSKFVRSKTMAISRCRPMSRSIHHDLSWYSKYLQTVFDKTSVHSCNTLHSTVYSDKNLGSRQKKINVKNHWLKTLITEIR